MISCILLKHLIIDLFYIVYSKDNITLNLNERSEIIIKNKSQLKIDYKMNLFLVHFFIDPKEFYLNFKSGAIIQKTKEVEESYNEEIYRNGQKAWRKALQGIKDFISSIRSAISDIMKGICWFKTKPNCWVLWCIQRMRIKSTLHSWT